MELYPLKFEPVYQYRIWAGNKLKTVLNKKYREDSIGESWEISDVDSIETKVLQGELKGQTLKQLIKRYKGDFVGNRVYKEFGDDFPLLIKFIDAKTPLSIQVHPDNDLAKERHNTFGKNEMWYVMQADKDAELIVGFNKKIEQEQYIDHLNKNTLSEIVNIEKVDKGDTFYIPTGRVHAIGAGVLLAEIQQTSNITYRIYDYDRIEKRTGLKRELHTEQALDAIDFEMHDNYKTNYDLQTNAINKLVHSKYFKTNIINLKGTMNMNYKKLDSFVIYMCVEGAMEVKYKNQTDQLKKGETILIPASIDQIELTSVDAVILEVSL